MLKSIGVISDCLITVKTRVTKCRNFLVLVFARLLVQYILCSYSCSVCKRNASSTFANTIWRKRPLVLPQHEACMPSPLNVELRNSNSWGRVGWENRSILIRQIPTEKWSGWHGVRKMTSLTTLFNVTSWLHYVMCKNVEEVTLWVYINSFGTKQLERGETTSMENVSTKYLVYLVIVGLLDVSFLSTCTSHISFVLSALM